MMNIFNRTASVSSADTTCVVRMPKTDTVSSDTTLVARPSSVRNYTAQSESSNDSSSSFSVSGSSYSSASSSVHDHNSYSRTARLFQYANYEKKTRQPEVQLGYSSVHVIHRRVETHDGQLLGWDIYRPPTVHFAPSCSPSDTSSNTFSIASSCSICEDERERKIFFVPAIEGISKVNMKAIRKVDHSMELLFRGRRMRLYCRKGFISPESYVLEAKAWE